MGWGKRLEFLFATVMCAAWGGTGMIGGDVARAARHPFNVTGTGLASCNPNPKYSAVVRIKIHDSIDTILSSSVSREVKYKIGKTDSVNDDTEYTNSTGNDWEGGYGPNETVVPFGVDATTIQFNPGPREPWIKIKILLNNRNTNNNAIFYRSSDGQINGITIDDASLTPSVICYGGLVPDNGHGRSVLTLFLNVPINPAGPKIIPFNIGLVSSAKATGTPIFIDPKIHNNGAY
jgi:hypothetical protein